MLHKDRSRSTGLWKYGFSAPLFILMLIVSAAAASSESNLLSVDGERTIKPIENIASISFSEMIKGKSWRVDEVNISNIEKGIADWTGLKARYPISARPANIVSEQKSASPWKSTIQDRMPSFPGGMKAWQEYLLNNVKYPALARSNNVKGIVTVSFTVEKDGSLGDIKVVSGIGSGADEEAIRVITQSPKWNPATIEGQAVRASYSVAINFGFTSPAEMSAGRALAEDVFAFSTLKVLPEFEGGMAGWGKYLRDNLKYPEQAKKDSISGRVILGFIVEKDGTLSDIKVLRGIGGGLDEEAVRVVKNSPTWKPGKILDGNLVRVAYTMPIFFQLASNQNTRANKDEVRPDKPISSADVQTFGSVEVRPEFPGGVTGWGKFLSANLKYPEAARKEKVTGRVTIGFIIEKDGSLSDVKVISGIGSGLDEEAMRVVKSSPKWKPGLIAGQPVRVAFTIPIFFQLGAK